MRARAAFLALSVAMASSAWTAEQERIRDFHSDIAIGADDSLTVTETIRLVSTADKIEHGILRDFPITLRDPWQRKTYGLSVLRVLRDGEEERYLVNTDEVPDHARIAIGSYTMHLPRGEHTYSLAYRTTRHIRFLPDHDELYFNLNGTEWEFPLDKVSATVTLPKGAKLLADRVAGYTGGLGATGKDFTWKQLPDGKVSFETTRPFKAGENLSIVVPIAKGAVAEPSAAEKRRAWVNDNLPATVALGGFAAVVAFLAVAWVLFGGWPLRPASLPRPEPPMDPESGRVLSPAEVAFLRGMGFDEGCVAPALLDMGVRGYLVIEEKKAEGGPQYTITRRAGDDRSKLTADEQRFADAALSGRTTLPLKSDDQTLFLGVRAMREGMEKEWAQATFRRHAFLRGLGWTLAGAGAIAAAFCDVLRDPLGNMIFFAVLCAPALLLVYVGLRYLLRQWWRAATGGARKVSVAAALGIGIPSAAAVYGLYWLSHFSTVWVPLGVFGMFLANMELGPFLKRYTQRGRLLMDQAKQLALYLTTRASDTAPRPTGPEPFETLLPYAMALGVADRWAHTFFGRFAQEVADAAVEPTEGKPFNLQDYAPAWFRAEQAWSLFERKFTMFDLLEHQLRRSLPSGRVTTTGTSTKRSTAGWRASTTGSGSRGYSGGGSGGGGGKGW